MVYNTKDLNSKFMDELRVIARNKGIHNPSLFKKKELIEQIALVNSSENKCDKEINLDIKNDLKSAIELLYNEIYNIIKLTQNLIKKMEDYNIKIDKNK